MDRKGSTHMEVDVLLARLELSEQGKDIHQLAVGAELVRDQGEQVLHRLLLHAGGVLSDEDGPGQLYVHIAGQEIGDRSSLQAGAHQLRVLVLFQLGGGHDLYLSIGTGGHTAGVQTTSLVQQSSGCPGASTVLIEFPIRN